MLYCFNYALQGKWNRGLLFVSIFQFLQSLPKMRFLEFLLSLHRRFSSVCLSFVLIAQVIYGTGNETMSVLDFLSESSDASESFNAGYANFTDLEQASIDRLLPQGYEMTESLRDTPMPKLGKSRLGQILTRFYEESMGGAETIDKLNSIKINSIYKTLGGEFDFEAISKKPNRLKVTATNDTGKMILAYNGSVGWSKKSNEASPRVVRDAHQLRRLSKDARFNSHLLYPFQKGKAYEYLGVLREADRICHLIRVHTQEQFVLDYYIDVETFLEVKLLQIDKLGHFEETELYYSDYKLVEGIPFAFRIETYIAGEWDSLFIAESVELNVGIFNWMFNFASEDFSQKVHK